jgi:hypothetical protein
LAVLTVNPSDYSPAQMLAAEMLCDLDSDLTLKQVAAEVGVVPETISRWRRDPRFVALCEYTSETNMRFSLIKVYKELHRSSSKGNTRAMEMLLKQQGKLVERREVVSEITVGSADKSTSQLALDVAELERRLLERTTAIDVTPTLTDGDSAE